MERWCPMSEPRKERCETCRFWDWFDTGQIGMCKRFPPVPLRIRSKMHSAWVDTVAGDWCGEWRSISEASRCMSSTEILQQLDEDELRERLDDICHERDALMVLIRAARRNKKEVAT